MEACRPNPLRLALAQLEIKPGRPAENTARILATLGEARTAGARLVLFPEMAIPGYLLGDEWERSAFLRECEACGDAVVAASAGLTVVFGNVALDWARKNEDGRVRKYNALFVAEEGRLLVPGNGLGYPFVMKSLMPNYREFDDSRHFYDLRKVALERGRSPADLVVSVATRAGRLGCTLCEDAWDDDYGFSPIRIMAARGEADLFVNISCSPYTFNKNHKRNRLFSSRAAEVGRPIAYVNNVGIQNNGKTVFTFDGASAVYGPGGSISECLPAFEEGLLTVDLPADPAAPLARPIELKEDSISDLLTAVSTGTRRFMKQLGVTRVVVGVSGGIDSAVVAALYRHLLPARDVILVNMPGPFTSTLTRGLAAGLAGELGCPYGEIPIQPSVEAARRQMDGFRLVSADGSLAETLVLTPFVMENVQARDRSARILAAVAASCGGVFTCNANKSEMTVGYSTLYGDLGGYLANIADLWKGEVYALGRHLNDAVYGRPVIPEGIFTVTPSAELSPDQNVDEGKGDPIQYPYHDCLYRSWVEAWNRATPEDILDWYGAGELEARLGYSGRVASRFPDARSFIADLERWWNLYQGMGVAKRIQAPPVLGVKRRAFGFDHRESQLGARYTARYQELKTRLLKETPG
jgi:NAD+ synthase (glutamine-hydrolysing)